MKYFRKDIIKVQVVGSLYKHRLLHGKNENNKMCVLIFSATFVRNISHSTKK